MFFKFRQNPEPEGRVIADIPINYKKSADIIISFQNKVDRLNSLFKKLDIAYDSNRISRKFYKMEMKRLKGDAKRMQCILSSFEKYLLRTIEKEGNPSRIKESIIQQE